MWTTVKLEGRTFRVDEGGYYEELVELPLDTLEMREDCQNPAKVEEYARMFRAGSPFPPISVSGITPVHPKYTIADGHHRYLAARAVGCRTVPAWTCFYVPFQGYGGVTYYKVARLSDTPLGRRLARHLGRQWCPRCGGFLNYRPGMQVCKSCDPSEPWPEQDRGGESHE